MTGESDKKESVIIIHLDREVDEQLMNEMIKSVISFMNIRWPINEQWKIPSWQLKRKTMAETKVFPCTCESKFQDKEYGRGRRLFNLRDNNKHAGEATCTVCGSKISNALKK